MLTLESLRARKGEILSIAQRFGAENIRVFGSVARGDQTNQSDIDFLVTLGLSLSLLKLAAMEEELKSLLGTNVDVVPEEDIDPRVKEQVLREAISL